MRYPASGGEVRALDDVSFEIAEGEFVALLGADNDQLSFRVGFRLYPLVGIDAAIPAAEALRDYPFKPHLLDVLEYRLSLASQGDAELHRACRVHWADQLFQ